MKIIALQPGAKQYPQALHRCGDNWFQPIIHSIGNTALFQHPLTALFCSAKCPGDIILKAFDRVAELRDQGRAIISGFHTPVEKECLRILLRGKSPIVICPARTLVKLRVPAEWKTALDAGRLLIASAFDSRKCRVITELAQQRNRFVAALANDILVLHAAPGGRLELFLTEIAGIGKPMCFLEKV